MISNKIGNEIDISVTKCYDSRSFYRTFEYKGKPYYKIGKPYTGENSCAVKKKPKIIVLVAIAVVIKMQLKKEFM